MTILKIKFRVYQLLRYTSVQYLQPRGVLCVSLADILTDFIET